MLAWHMMFACQAKFIERVMYCSCQHCRHEFWDILEYLVKSLVPGRHGDDNMLVKRADRNW